MTVSFGRMSSARLRPAPPSLSRRSGRSDILSAPVFRAVLSRECARSDRSGGGFALVVFRIGGGRRIASTFLRHLVRTLAARMRESDVIGWLDERRVAAVLPATSAEGAGAFVASLHEAVGPHAPAPSCTIHTYPWSSTAGPCPEGASARDAAPVPGFRMPLWKRAMDVAGALLSLVLLSPVFAGVALLIKAVSPGSVFFRQERIGHMGRPFILWKFRTMHAGSGAESHEQHLKRLIHGDDAMEKLDEGRDSRIIPCGRFLRQACLDELPQLFNVLGGTMSLVGPRPCLPYEAREFEAWCRRRFAAVPGMTGLWQVSGKNRTTFKEMIRLDIAYIRNASFCLDVKILLRTVSVLLGLAAEHFTKHASVAPDGVTDPAPERTRAGASMPREGRPPRHDERRSA
jgi:lipopolysaccharide/colanic/teichoic acid biosynthesis glycosyltransferase